MLEQTTRDKPGRRENTFAVLLTDTFRPSRSKTFLHRQLFEHLKHAIESGHLPPGAKLPSSRSLAAELNISRNTIVVAYELLAAEGLIETQLRGGTRVKDAPQMANEEWA